MSNFGYTGNDPFGRILAMGGDQTFALGMARGYPEARLDAIMSRRFGDDYSAAKEQLVGFAQSMAFAADIVNDAANTGGNLNLSEIPNNPFGDESESGGNILKWSADVTFEGASSAVTVYGESASTDIESIIAAAIAGGMGVADEYRGKFGLGPDDSIVPTSVSLLTLKSIINNGSISN